ncbi:MAG: hypothetical protein LBN37_08515 [Bacteroidales bacterium]|jgi:hypothetical protein|nr:hypothetical protein [Bacteroidales bacterium]
MKVKILLGFMLCVLSVTTQAQTFKDRLFFGGNFGLMIGQFTDIELSPHVGYYITNRWAAGVGITYEYYNNKYHFQDPYPPYGFERYESHIYGGRLFTNYVLVNNVNDYIPLGLNFRIFAHAEYEMLAYEKGFFRYGDQGRQLINSFLVGGGFRFPMGKRSSMNLTLLWKLNSNDFLSDIYGSGPVIRIGYNF